MQSILEMENKETSTTSNGVTFTVQQIAVLISIIVALTGGSFVAGKSTEFNLASENQKRIDKLETQFAGFSEKLNTIQVNQGVSQEKLSNINEKIDKLVKRK